MTLHPIVRKELISVFRRDYLSKTKQIASLLMSAFLNIVLVAFVVTLYLLLDSKVSDIIVDGISFSVPMIILILGLMIGIYTIINTMRFSKVLYNQDDRYILKTMPLKETTILFPKLFTNYLRILATFAVMFFSLLIAFGVVHLDDPTFSISWWYWPLSVVFTFVTPCIIVFISLILSYPYKLITLFINRHPFAQLFVSIVVVAILSYAYFVVIDLFSNLITNDNLHLVFSTSNIQKMNFVSKFVAPINYMMLVLCNQDKWLYFMIYVAVILIALASSYFIALGYHREYSKIDERFTVFEKKHRKLSKFPLLVKDFRLMFRNSSGSLSFVVYAFAASIFSTFLAYFTNKLFASYGLNNFSPSSSANGAGGLLSFISYLQLPVAILFVTLSISMVFSSETKLFLKEKRTASLILTIPAKFKTQIFSKLIINCSVLLFVNILAFVLIASFGIFPNPFELITLFVCSLFITFATFFIGVAHTLTVTKSLSSTNDIATTGSFNFLISLFAPIVVVGISAALLYLFSTLEGLASVSGVITFSIIMGICAVVFALSIVLLVFRIKKFSRYLSTGEEGNKREK